MKSLVQSPRALGRVLRSARRQRGLTQQQLAEMTGSSQPTLSQIEQGKTAISIVTLLRLLSALRLEMILQDRSPTQATGPWDES